MNNTLLENWNHTVTSDDTVYVLGDMIWAKEAEWPFWLGQLVGNKVLIAGNHDPKQFSQTTKRFFQDIKEYKEITDSGKRVILCHYPMPFHKAAWGENCYMLYGHVHNTREYVMLEQFRKQIKESYIERGHARGNFINVGCMTPWMNYTPQTLDDILQKEAQWHQQNWGSAEKSDLQTERIET